MQSAIMESKSPPPVFSEDMSQTACIIEMKKLGEKLRRAYQRRDHYAQLYYKALAELEDTKWELDAAKKKIQELTSRGDTKSVAVSSVNDTVNTTTINTSSPQDVKNDIANNDDSSSGRDSGLVVTPSDISTESTSPKPCESPQHGTIKTSSNNNNNSPKVKRVAFSDQAIPKPMIIQRSFSVSDGEHVNGMYSPPPMNHPVAIQRTQSFSRGKPIQPVTAYMRGGPHIASHVPTHIPPPPPGTAHYDHRLPRVHRNLAYETAVPPPQIYSQQIHTSPHHSPAPVHSPPISAFRLVQPHVPVHPADYRNHPRYSSLPLRNQRPFIQGFNEGRWRFTNLNRTGLMSLFSDMSSPEAVDIRKLEISSSGLGNVEMMSLLCRELKKKQTIEELSLPNNEIGDDALKILLDSVSVCKNINHLKLTNNNITSVSLEAVQHFLEKISLRSFVLTGNEIEHHTHLLEIPLPQDSNEEYRRINNVVSDTTEHHQNLHHGIYSNQPIIPSRRNAKMSASSSLPHNMKFLHI